MQNQAEVNFPKWHLSSHFSKVNFQKSTSVKSPIGRSNVKGEKRNYQSPILAKVQFQKTNVKRQISSRVSDVKFFKEKFSKSNSHSSFQIQIFKAPISKVNWRSSERAFQSPLFESQTIPIQTLESETFQSPILTGTFEKPTFSKSSLPSELFNFNTCKENLGELGKL